MVPWQGPREDNALATLHVNHRRVWSTRLPNTSNRSEPPQQPNTAADCVLTAYTPFPNELPFFTPTAGGELTELFGKALYLLSSTCSSRIRLRSRWTARRPTRPRGCRAARFPVTTPFAAQRRLGPGQRRVFTVGRREDGGRTARRHVMLEAQDAAVNELGLFHRLRISIRVQKLTQGRAAHGGAR